MSVISDFEAAIADYLQLPKEHIICCNSGSSALLSTLLSTIVPGEEVGTSAFTFPATVNAIYLAGGVPVFYDVVKFTHHLDMTYSDLKFQTVIYPTLFQQDMILPNGRPFCLIEDAAQNFKYSAVRNENADFATFSFYKTKKLSTFEGGAIYAADPDKALKIRSIINQGRGIGRHDFPNFGFNFRMAEPLAEIGLKSIKDENFNLNEKQMSDGFYPYIIPDLEYMQGRKFYCQCLKNAQYLAKKVASYVN
jgi:perosamine synthetase